ncbi:MAG TPA: response regulator [Anaerolineales bacterium]|nr:response regulator [Anaerolineales bacterium]
MAAERYTARGNLHVLVCDDDPAMLDLMARRLQRMGLTVDKAGGGAEAATRLSQNDYDLLVTDIYMPEITGLELLQQFKAKTPQGQVVVATASATLESAVEALNHGAFAYLTKPFDHLSVFDNVVSRAIDFRRLLIDNQRMADVQRRRGDLLEEEVTSRIQKLKGQQQYLTTLLACLPMGVIVWDEDKARVVLSNPVAERLLGSELEDAPGLFQRLSMTLPSQSGSLQGETVLPGGQARATLVDMPMGEGRRQKMLVLVEVEAGAITQGTMLVEAISQLGKGVNWLVSLPQEGETARVLRVVVQQLREVERLAGLPPTEMEPPPAPAPPAPKVEASVPEGKHALLDRGRALLRGKSSGSDVETKPTGKLVPTTGKLVPRPDDLERSLQRWAKEGEPPPSADPNGGNGENHSNGESGAPKVAWPPPLPTRVEH